jgi:high affinity Mn2+ porin
MLALSGLCVLCVLCGETSALPASPVETERRSPLGDPSRDFEHWNLFFQSTYIWQKHPGFSAPYDGPQSLSSHSESGYSLTATLFLGLRPWRGTEVYFNPEVAQAVLFSGLHGLGGFSNSENQKSASPRPTLYSARAFVRQTFHFGGETAETSSGPNQFSDRVSSRRLVLTVGQVSVIDIFDNNAYAHDGRTQFMNWAFLTHGASDYAADVRGYTWGAAAEYVHDDWVFRFGRFAQPKRPNGEALDFRLWEHYGDNLEIEHAHNLRGRPGKLRLMAVRNFARMGAFADAIELAATENKPPEVAEVRRNQAKYTLGLAWEQAITAEAGVFGRLNWNDGRTETYAFTEIDHSYTLGAVSKGRYWRRPGDTFGLALAWDGISDSHRDYLARGGLGAFLGDGQLPHYGMERILEVYYSCAPVRGWWTSVGYQWIGNPGYNADRGPVSAFLVRVHTEL